MYIDLHTLKINNISVLIFYYLALLSEEICLIAIRLDNLIVNLNLIIRAK